MVEQADARFAVGDFADWQPACETARELGMLGVRMDAISFLGLRRDLSERLATLEGFPHQLQDLAFRDSPAVVCCSPGVLADRLAERLAKGAASLGDALGHWLLPRQARRIQRSVNDGILFLWVQVFDAAEERRACRGLLAHCLTGAEVHDLKPSIGQKGSGGNGSTPVDRTS